VGCPSVPAAKAELKRVQAAAEQQRAVMAAELTAAQTAEAAARADASKARAAHASCSCQLQEAQQEVAQVCSQHSGSSHRPRHYGSNVSVVGVACA
jgi:hypothetical protein